MKTIKDIPYCDSDCKMQTLDLFLPEIEAFPVFIYFHGGGMCSGSKTNCFPIEKLVDKGVAVISAEYRMYPSAVYPEFIEDAASAVAWAYNNMQKYGTPKSFFVGGSSAGGYLTQMLCFNKQYLGLHNIDADKVDGYFMDAGQPTAHFNVLKARGLNPKRVIIDETAPLFYVEPERKYAPMEIIVSDHDMENRYEQTKLLVSTLKHCGADMDKVVFKCIENSNHCQYVQAIDGNGNSKLADMIYSFISYVIEKDD